MISVNEIAEQILYMSRQADMAEDFVKSLFDVIADISDIGEWMEWVDYISDVVDGITPVANELSSLYEMTQTAN